MDENAQWLKVKDVCNHLSINRNTFYSLVNKGLLEAKDINKGQGKRKVYRVEKAALERYLQSL